MDKFLGFKTEEILTFLLLIVVGYVIAKMFSRCGCSSGNGFSVGIQDKYPGGPCTPGIRQCRPNSEDKEYIYDCPPSGVCERVEARCGEYINDCQDTPTSTCERGHLCENKCIAPKGGINGQWDGGDGGRQGGWCKGTAPTPTPTPTPTPVDESCTYSGDNITNTNPRSFIDYVNEEKLDSLQCPKFQKKIDECKDAWKNYYNERDQTYDGSFCMQTLPDETNPDELKGRGHCPLTHDADGKPYPADWITNGQTFSIDEAKNQCKLSYLDGEPVGTIDKQENAPGRYAWVSGTNENDCDCPESPTPSKSCSQDKHPFTNDSNYTDYKGDCPRQSGEPNKTCCYATTKKEIDFFQHYEKETRKMKKKCKNLKGTFTGPTTNKEVIKLGFSKLTGTNPSGDSIENNELFCYYNDSEKNPNEHIKYCGNNSEYKNGHAYFCSFPSSKKHKDKKK